MIFCLKKEQKVILDHSNITHCLRSRSQDVCSNQELYRCHLRPHPEGG